jgi:hypothetical protein
VREREEKEREKAKVSSTKKSENSRLFLHTTLDARFPSPMPLGSGKGRVLSRMYVVLNIIITSHSLFIIGARGERHRRRNIREKEGKRQRETDREEETEKNRQRGRRQRGRDRQEETEWKRQRGKSSEEMTEGRYVGRETYKR